MFWGGPLNRVARSTRKYVNTFIQSLRNCWVVVVILNWNSSTYHQSQFITNPNCQFKIHGHCPHGLQHLSKLVDLRTISMMSQIPEVPRRVYARMPKKWQDAVDEKRAESRRVSSSVATTSKVRSVSDFLEEKVRVHQCELDYLQSVHEGIHRAYDSHLLSPEEFRDAVSPFLSSAKQVSAELGTICRQRKIIEEDLEESVNAKRQRHGEPSREMLERAYTSSILERVMAARSKQKKDKSFNPRKFRKAVNDYYGINLENGIDPGAGYCHVLGIFNAEDIKAAHIVPKSLNGDEIAHLFGVKELVPEDPRNGKIQVPVSLALV